MLETILKGIRDELKGIRDELKESNRLKKLESSTPKMEKEVISTNDTKEEETEKSYTKDEVLKLGKEFLPKADASTIDDFKEKLEEFGTDKLRLLDPKHFNEIVEFMNARLSK